MTPNDETSAERRGPGSEAIVSSRTRPAGLRVLIINSHLPIFPGGAGVEWRTTKLLAGLAERVGLVSIAQSPDDLMKAAGLADAGVELYVDAPPLMTRRPSSLRRLAWPLRALHRQIARVSQRCKAGARPLDTVNSDGCFRDMAAGLREALAGGSWHVVAVVGSSAAHYLDRLPRLPISVLILHDVRARLCARRSETAGSPLRRRALARQARRYESYERRYCRSYDLVVTVSEEDAAWVREHCEPRRLLVLPLPVDAERHGPQRIAATCHQRLREVVAERAAEGEDEPLRVALDMRFMVPGRAGGLEVVARAFLEQLREIDGRNQYTVLLPARCRFDFECDQHPNVRLLADDSLGAYLRGMGRSLRRALHRLARLDAYDSQVVAGFDFLRRTEADIAFSFTGQIVPDLAPLRHVLLVVDILHEYHPEFFAPEALELRRLRLVEGLRRADHVCVISEFTRRTLVDRLGASEDEITVTPLAAAPRFKPKRDARDGRLLRDLDLQEGRYLLLPAHTWRHKNHRAALEALRILRDRHGLRPQLVCTGEPREAQPELEALIAEAGLAAQVRFPGYQPAEAMPALYRGAAALVFPSLFEGFGMPVVEAMAAGCPVACSNRASLPEVAGSAALLIDPHDHEAWAEAVRRLLVEPELRAQLRQRGFDQAARFSWRRHVTEVIAVFERVRFRSRRI